MPPTSSLKRLLQPTTIAVVGGSQAAAVIRQCDKIGYQGEIFPVHPQRSDMAGRRCYRSIAELPVAPDATFVAVPRAATIETVAALAQRGAGGVVCFASGFAEVGEEGAAYQRQLQKVIGELALVGPNCYGVLNYLDGVALWPDEQGGKRVERGVAIITQSGNICLNLSMQQRCLPLAYLISTGNQAGVTIPEYVDALLDDPRVTAIGIHLEGLSDVMAFSHAAHRALRQRVPLVVIKSGASALAERAMLTHTSSLAGADRLYDALFDRLGVLRVHSLPQFLEALKLFTVIGPLPVASLASISCSGGEAGLVADAAAALGLIMPPLHEAQRQALFAVLGEKVALANPLDYHTYIWGDEEAQYRCFSAMLLGDQAITLKILDYPRAGVCDTTSWDKTGRAFARAVVDQGARGALVATLHENLPPAAGEALLAHGIAPMLGLEECLIAIRGAAQIYAKQQQVAEILPLATQHHQASNQQVNEKTAPPLNWGRVGGGTLTEAQGKALLKRYGIPTPRGRECTAATAVACAADIGFPVVLKVSSHTIVHKSDVGGVCLNLSTPEAVEQAIAQMVEAGLGDQFLVEAMAPQPLAELILGITRDRQFGLALVIGAGGVWVELLKASVTLLFPVQRAEVAAALEQLPIAPLLNGNRGQPPADKAALIEAVINLARLAEDHAAALLEVDINPLFVLPDGVLSVDAVVRFKT
jgi:acetyl-CoA synthetase